MDDEIDTPKPNSSRTINEIAAVAIVAALGVLVPHGMTAGDKLGDHMLGPMDEVVVPRGAPRLRGTTESEERAEARATAAIACLMGAR